MEVPAITIAALVALLVVSLVIDVIIVGTGARVAEVPAPIGRVLGGAA